MTTKTTKQNKNAGINHDTRASENVANKTMAPMRHLGVGIDTARYGHHVTFLREDKQPAARPLPMTESRTGYQQLQQQLELLHQRHPEAHIHLRIDAAGQYAANLEAFVRSLDHLPMTVSVCEPKRNKDYHRAHSPKRKNDASESYAMARYAVVERPSESFGKPLEFAVLRRVASRLQAQTKQTTRLTNQLHETLSAAFPELATLVSDITAGWVVELLTKYPTAGRIAAARLSSLEKISFLKPEKARQLHEAAKRSVGTLSGELADELIGGNPDWGNPDWGHSILSSAASSAAHERNILDFRVFARGRGFCCRADHGLPPGQPLEADTTADTQLNYEACVK